MEYVTIIISRENTETFVRYLPYSCRSLSNNEVDVVPLEFVYLCWKYFCII